MTPRVRATGVPVARECRDGGQVKLSTFIPLKIRKRGASKVVRPDGQIEAPGKVATQHDQPRDNGLPVNPRGEMSEIRCQYSLLSSLSQ
jgi:hypothetical protein